MSNVSIELILCDVGGVLGTNGWDHDERIAASRKFGFDPDEFERRHEEAVDTWETGDMTMNEYLDFTLFNVPRSFARDDVIMFMRAQSVPHPDTLRLMQNLAAKRRWRMMTLNNESAELNAYRIDLFGLAPIFSAFLTSAYVAAQKPHGIFYDRALRIAYATPDRTVFIDDRPPNLLPAAERGLHTVHATGTDSIRAGLAALGVAEDDI